MDTWMASVASLVYVVISGGSLPVSDSVERLKVVISGGSLPVSDSVEQLKRICARFALTWERRCALFNCAEWTDYLLRHCCYTSDVKSDVILMTYDIITSDQGNHICNFTKLIKRCLLYGKYDTWKHKSFWWRYLGAGRLHFWWCFASCSMACHVNQTQSHLPVWTSSRCLLFHDLLLIIVVLRRLATILWCITAILTQISASLSYIL